jgi:imidazole glycerol-phosphate synthase subunit HisH
VRRPRVVVFDYGSGNIRSAERAVARAGADVEVSADPAAALACDGLVVPGVGAYAAVMSQLSGVDGGGIVRKRLAQQAPVLGICVGMQVLFDSGDEHGVHTEGLGLLPGTVRRLDAPILPHMGWSTVTPPAGTRLFAGVEGERFYFVHSYAAVDTGAVDTGAVDTGAVDTAGAVTTAEHGERFVAAVEGAADGALAATQFHPEKSGDAGARLLANWIGMLR